jgi:hypothetical protein
MGEARVVQGEQQQAVQPLLNLHHIQQRQVVHTLLRSCTTRVHYNKQHICFLVCSKSRAGSKCLHSVEQIKLYEYKCRSLLRRVGWLHSSGAEAPLV